MRLLLAIPSLGPGGSERVLTVLAGHWADRGHEVSLVTFDPPESDFFAPDPRARRFVIGGSGPAGAGWLRANRARVVAFRAAVREARPDVVVSFLYTMNLLALVAVRNLAPVVVAERTDPRRFRVERWQSVLRRLLYRRAAAVVVQTQAVLEGWARRVAAPGRACAVPNPVLPPRARGAGPTPTPGPYVVAVGRLDRDKGNDVLVDAFARIATRHPEWSLVLLGDGPEREPLRRQADALALGERLVLPGLVDPGPLVAHASVFASASRVEGFPNALLEAMAHGLAVVVTDCDSGPREIVRDGVDGLLVPVDDVGALAGALDRLVDDPLLRSALGRRATEVLERYGLERVGDVWEELFERVAAQPR